MPHWKWTTIALDPRSDPPVEQDITRRVDWQRTRPPQVTYGGTDQGTLALIHLERSPDLWLQNTVEIWQGWRDTDTGEWDGSRDVFGFYILSYEATYRGKRLDALCDTVSFNWLLDRCPFLTWPTDLSADEPAAGYPPGKTVRDWLIGVVDEGLPYDGLIPFHFNPATWNFGGVAPVLNTLFFTETIMPSMPTISEAELYGHFGFMSVRAVLDEILKAAREVARREGLDLRPAVSVQPLAVGTSILKRFCALDLRQDAQDMTPVAVFSIDPAEGEYPIIELHHRRAGDTIQTGAIVLSDSDRADGFLWSERTSVEGVATYPAREFRRPYWGGPAIHSSDLATQAETDSYTQAIADIKWGAIGTLWFSTYCPLPIREGDYIELHFPPQGQNHHILPVIKVDIETGKAGPIKKTLTVGEREQDINDILIPALDAPLVVRGTGTLERSGGVVWTGPGSFRAIPVRGLVQIATTPRKNVVQGRDNSIPALVIQGTPANAPTVGEVPGDPPGDIAILTRVWDSVLGGAVGKWIKTVYTDKYGTPHAQAFLIPFTADGMYPWPVHQRLTIRAAQMPSDPVQAGVTYSIAVNRAGTVEPAATVALVAGVTVLSAPFEVLPGDRVEVTASGVPAGGAEVALISGDPL